MVPVAGRSVSMQYYLRSESIGRRSVVGWGLLMLALVAMPLSSPEAVISNVSIGPSSPSNSSAVWVKVQGWYPDLCYFPQGTSVHLSGDTIHVTAHAFYDAGTWCFPMIREYSDSVESGPFAPGTYTVFVSDFTPTYVTLTLTVTSNPDCCQGMTGNINGSFDDLVDISDLVYLVDYMFTDGPVPPCLEEADIDGSGGSVIDITDLVHIVGYMFEEGPPPADCP